MAPRAEMSTGAGAGESGDRPGFQVFPAGVCANRMAVVPFSLGEGVWRLRILSHFGGREWPQVCLKAAGEYQSWGATRTGAVSPEEWKQRFLLLDPE